MQLFNPFKAKKSQDNWFISLDIGTEFIKTLIVEISEDKAFVRGVGRQRQKLTDMSGGGVTSIGGVIKNCESALEQAASQAGILPDNVIIGMAGELVKGTTTTVKYTRSLPKTKISSSELEQIIAKVQQRAFDRARKVLAYETGREEVDVKLVNAAIAKIEIDGYKITNPIGFQGKEIEVGIYNSFAPIVQFGALQTVADDLDLNLMAIVAEPYAVAKCLGANEVQDFSAIFIDIGGGTTDIALVDNGGLIGTKMFALGGRAFTKRVCDVVGGNFLEAEKTKINYSAGNLPKQTMEMIAEALKTDAEVWLSGVELTLEEFSEANGVDILPTRIYLCGGGTMLPEIETILKNDDWYKRLPFAKKPVVSFISPKDVVAIEDATGELHSVSDVTPLALANSALDIAGPIEIMDHLMQKVVGGLKK